MTIVEMNRDTPMELRKLKMLEFIVSRSDVRDIKKENDWLLIENGKRRFAIKTIAEPKDWPLVPKAHPGNMDSDWKKVIEYQRSFEDAIAGINDEGYIPGIIFLRAISDNIDGKTHNSGNFLKQAQPTIYSEHPLLAEKNLHPLEIALQRIYNRTTRNINKSLAMPSLEKLYGLENLKAKPELLYFDTSKKGSLVAVNFADINPEPNSRYCPACKNPNEEQYDHQACKTTRPYIDYAKRRDFARYHKLIRKAREYTPQSTDTKENAIDWVFTTIIGSNGNPTKHKLATFNQVVRPLDDLRLF